MGDEQQAAAAAPSMSVCCITGWAVLYGIYALNNPDVTYSETGAPFNCVVMPGSTVCSAGSDDPLAVNATEKWLLIFLVGFIIQAVQIFFSCLTCGAAIAGSTGGMSAF